MTENDMLIQTLWRENDRLQKTVEYYRRLHQEDIAELAMLRRMIECIVESGGKRDG